jgi:hypothetical protein
MSWQDARSEAKRIYAEMRAKHNHGFVGMVIDALRREHARDKPKRADEDAEKSDGQKRPE